MKSGVSKHQNIFGNMEEKKTVTIIATVFIDENRKSSFQALIL